MSEKSADLQQWSGPCGGCDKHCALRFTLQDGALVSLEGNTCGRGMSAALLARKEPEKYGFAAE